MSNKDERVAKINTNDRRVKRTKKLLRDSLFSLLQTKSINEITITELTEVADINRATFYFYYTDIFDMLDQIQNEAYEMFETVLQGTEEHINSQEAFAKYIENILLFCKENPSIARFVITREYNNNKVLKKIKKLLAKNVPVAKEMPIIVNLGVLLDLFIAVFILGMLVREIDQEFHDLEVSHLSDLKDYEYND